MRLILRPFDDLSIFEGCGPFAAADRAAKTGVLIFPVVLPEGTAGNLVRLFELSLLEIAGGQRPHHIDNLQDISRPLLAEHAHRARHAHRPEGQLQGALVLLFIMNVHAPARRAQRWPSDFSNPSPRQPHRVPGPGSR